LKIIVSGSFADRNYQARFEARSRIPRRLRGASDDVEDIGAVPTPFTPACDGHPLAPIAGPILVRGAKFGDVVAIDVIELTPFGVGNSAILQDFGVLRREFPEPMALSSRDLTASTVERHRRG
jgi:acetamidase/formamidase